MDLDFRFRGLNGHQNRGCRLPLVTQPGHGQMFGSWQASGERFVRVVVADETGVELNSLPK